MNRGDRRLRGATDEQIDRALRALFTIEQTHLGERHRRAER